MKALVFVLILAVAGMAAVTRPSRAADCWVITCVRTGDVGIGSTTHGMHSLGCAITGRKARLVYLINPATGKGATFRIFVGGKVSTTMTWAQFVAAEGGRRR